MFNLKNNDMCLDCKPTLPVDCKDTIPLTSSIWVDGNGNAFNEFRQKIGTYTLSEDGKYIITMKR